MNSPILKDEDLVSQINDIKFNLKPSLSKSNMCKAFNSILNKFIQDWNLGDDPSSFASMPSIRDTFKFAVGDAVRIIDNNTLATVISNYSVLDKNKVINRYLVQIDNTSEALDFAEDSIM